MFLLALEVLLFGFAVYNCWQVLSHVAQLREFNVSAGRRNFWIGLAIITVLGLFAAFISRASNLFPIYPVPFGILYFAAPIIAGQLARHQLLRQGTSRTEELEKIASNTTWVGIFSIGLILIFWCMILTGASISSDRISR